ncbi:alpha/beta-hydrolase [Amylocystis lapponica]|nr:alpha/beta-hydrolase [Amylocystis lapponica]
MTSFLASSVSLTDTSDAIPGLQLVAKRYVHNLNARPAPTTGLTLIFTHCTGTHKEIWEPVIGALMKLTLPGTDTPLVREAWAVDTQNHGDSAVLNAALFENDAVRFSATDLASGLRALVASDHLAGHQVIGIGHSFGASAIMLSTMPGSEPAAPYKAIILVESVLCQKTDYDLHLPERDAALRMLDKLIAARRDEWRDRAEALQYFRKRLPWKIWDARVLHLFVEHGLRDVPAAGTVALKCSKQQEKVAFNDNDPHFVATDRLGTLDASVPVHCVFGARNDSIPRYVQDSCVAMRKMASISYVPRAGHLVVQENPDGLAERLREILYGIAGHAHAKL